MGFSQKGNSLVIILLIIGMITGGVIIDKKIHQNPVPTASPEPQADTNPTIILSVENNQSLSQLKKDDTFAALVSVSTNEPVNLISAKIDYPKDLLKVTSIDDLGDEGVISLWVTKSDFPEEGRVELIGGIPTPGIKTEGKRVAFAKINFQFRENPQGKEFNINPKEVELYSDKDNQPLKDIVTVPIHLKAEASKPSTGPANTTPQPSSFENKSGKGKLTLTPSLLQTSSSCTFDITLNYDAGSETFLGIDALITVDPKVLKPVKVVATNDPPDVLYAPQLSFKNDTVTIAYLSPKTRAYKSKGSLAKITFQVTDQKASGLTAIKIKHNIGKQNDLTDSNIIYSLNQDLLSQVSNTIVSVKPGSCNTPKTYEVLPQR